MERLSIDHFEDLSLKAEHLNRYKFVALWSYGTIVDCACGVGYSTSILNCNTQNTYLGIDISEETIGFANSLYKNKYTSFQVGSITELNLDNESVDTFISMETLEHLQNPEDGIKEIARVLKKYGIFIGSVPSKYFEKLCTDIYGPNPFHLTTFSFDSLMDLLKQYFRHVNIYAYTFDIVSRIKPLNYERIPVNIDENLDDAASNINPRGSYIFVVSNNDMSFHGNNIGKSYCYYGLNLVEYDQYKINPLQTNIKQLEEMINERDKAIESQTQVIEERWNIISNLERMVAARDDTIRSQEKMIEERWNVIQTMEQMIISRDEVIDTQSQLIQSKVR